MRWVNRLIESIVFACCIAIAYGILFAMSYVFDSDLGMNADEPEQKELISVYEDN